MTTTTPVIFCKNYSALWLVDLWVNIQWQTCPTIPTGVFCTIIQNRCTVKPVFQQNNKRTQTLAAGVYTAVVGENKHNLIMIVTENDLGFKLYIGMDVILQSTNHHFPHGLLIKQGVVMSTWIISRYWFWHQQKQSGEVIFLPAKPDQYTV